MIGSDIFMIDLIANYTLMENTSPDFLTIADPSKALYLIEILKDL